MSISPAVTGHSTHYYYRRTDAPQAEPAPDAAPGAAALSSIDASGSDTAGASLATLLGQFGLGGNDTTSAPGEPAAAEGGHPKPNLDALHRVLAHYRAQSDAMGTTVSLSP